MITLKVQEAFYVYFGEDQRCGFEVFTDLLMLRTPIPCYVCKFALRCIIDTCTGTLYILYVFSAHS